MFRTPLTEILYIRIVLNFRWCGKGETHVAGITGGKLLKLIFRLLRERRNNCIVHRVPTVLPESINYAVFFVVPILSACSGIFAYIYFQGRRRSQVIVQ